MGQGRKKIGDTVQKAMQRLSREMRMDARAGEGEDLGDEGSGGSMQQVVRRIQTFSHSLWTSDSLSCLHCIKLSIQPSRVGMLVGSTLIGPRSGGMRPT